MTKKVGVAKNGCGHFLKNGDKLCFHSLKVTPTTLRYKLTENASGNTY